MSPELPGGTVAFLFTDIEGSTRLVARIGDTAYSGLLAQERALVLEAAIAEGGVPFGSEGDAHFVAFTAAGNAIRAAVRGQRALVAHPWPDGQQIEVRMGVHAGEVQVADRDYVGYEVHRAARVAAAAHGGQVLVSGAARSLAGDPGAGIELHDLGEHTLRDVAAPERLFQADCAGLRTRFPPPRATGPVTGNLPVQLTSFVGRAEVEAAGSLLSRTRLLTLTGPGGTGKTRLSLVLAADCADRYPDGAWFVPLAAVRDPELVPSSIAGALGLLSASQPPLERVREHLRDRRLLLVLDNLEQVLDGALIIAELLREAPGITVLATSRAPLRIAGEQEFPVPPLSVPLDGAGNPDAVTGSEAGRLFEERARAVRPGFAVDAANAGDVAEIVRRVDGLPLAIELAAARVRLLPPRALARRLDDRLNLLEGSARDLPDRQRTLRGAIDWSHDLLGPAERRLFARLSAFAGGGRLELAEEVCALPEDRVEDEGRPPDVLETLERLAEQSLVRIEPDAHGDVRFTMLETIREYAAERLAERGETGVLADRHAAAVLGMVGDVEGGDDRGAWLDRLDEEHDNLRAAIDHAIAAGDTVTAATLGWRVWRFWQMRGHIVEGRRRISRILAMPAWTEQPSPDRMRALEAAGGLAYWAGDMVDAGVHYGAAVDEARGLGDEPAIANAVYNHWFTRRPTEGVTEWAQLLADDDRQLLDEALEIWTRLGDETGVAKALWGLGEHHAYREESEAAEVATTKALAIFERTDDAFWIAWTRFTRAFARAIAGNVRGSAEDVAISLRVFRASRDVSGLCLSMSALASMLITAGRNEDAVAIGSAAERAITETGLHLAGLWPTASFRMPDTHPADPAGRAAAERGRSWTREQALDEAIRLCDEVAGVPAASPDGPATT